MFCLNELTVLPDTALQSTDSPRRFCHLWWTPCVLGVTEFWITCSERPHFFLPPLLQLCKWLKKIWLLFPAVPYLRRGPLMCEAVCEQATPGLVFVTLQPLQHPVGEPLCRMPLQGMVFVRAWAKATTSNPLLSLQFFFFFFLRIRARQLCIQACNFTDLIQTKSKAYLGALVHR